MPTSGGPEKQVPENRRTQKHRFLMIAEKDINSIEGPVWTDPIKKIQLNTRKQMTPRN